MGHCCALAAEWLISCATLQGTQRMRARGFVFGNEQVLDSGCVAVVNLSEKI